jgi:hypothetical protein
MVTKISILLLHLTSQKTIGIFFNTGNVTFTTPVIYQDHIIPELVVVGDVNGDNQPDIIVGHARSFGALYTYCH